MSGPARPARHRRHRLGRAVAAALVALAAVATTALSTPLSAPARAAGEPAALPVQVQLTKVTPALTTREDTLVVQGFLLNTGQQPVERLRVTPRLGRDPLTGRDEITGWATAGSTDEDLADVDRLRWPGGRVELDGPLAAGARRAFQVQLPVRTLGWQPDEADAGVYALALDVTGDTGSGPERVGLRRTFAVWFPDTGAAPTRLSLLVPVEAGADGPQTAAGAAEAAGGRPAAASTPTPSTSPGPAGPTGGDGAGLPSALRDQLAPGGRLDRVLSATAPVQVAWALDPALVEAAQSDSPGGGDQTGGVTPTTAPTTVTTGPDPAAGSPSGPPPGAPTLGTAFLRRLTALRQNRSVTILPWGDPDVVALTHGGAPDLLRTAQAAGAARAAAVVGNLPDETLAWPADGWADRPTLDLLARTGHREVVLSADGYPPASEPASTPSGLAATTGKGLTALLTDPALSAGLTASGSADSVATTQRMLADLAAITLERPSDPRRLLAVAPRGWDPADPAAVRSTLTALGSVPWVRLSPLSELRAAAVPQQPARAVRGYPAQARAAELPTAHVRAVEDARQRLARFGPVLADTSVTQPLRTEAMALVSNGWRGRGGELDRARADFVAKVDRFYGGVTVEQDSVINLIAQTGDLPITVANQLDYPVHVLLTLRPLTGRLRAVRAVPVDLEAHSSRRVQVPVRAVASGSVQVEARIAAPDGSLLATPPVLLVRVFPGLESRLLIGFGIALGLLLVSGIFRSVRRSRVRMRPEDVPDLDDTHPEALEDAARTGAIPVLRPEPDPADRPSPHGRHVAPDGAEPALARLGAPAMALSTSGAPAGSTVNIAEPSARSVPVGPSGTGSVADAQSDPSADGGGAGGPATGPIEVTGGDDADSTASTMRSSALMASGTLASRILGLVNSAILAAAIGVIGDGPEAFSVANKVPNIAYILLIGGALNVVLVPQIVKASKRPDGGQDYIDRLITLSLTVIGGLTVLVTLAAPVWVYLYSQSWTSQRFALGVAFAYWCLPQLFFYGMYTVLGQVLNARGRFGAYMWAPVVNNVVVIAGVAAFMAWRTAAPRGHAQPAAWWGSGEIAALGGIYTLGIAAQALVLVPVLRSAGFRWRPRWGFRGVGLGTASKVAGWSLAAVVLNQIGFAVVQRAVTAAGSAGDNAGSAAYDRAFLLYIVPHSLVTVSLVTALFTRLSRSAANDDLPGVRADVSLGLRTTGVAMLLASAAFVALGPLITFTIFPGTRVEVTDAIAHGAMALALGLVFFSAHYSFQRVFFAFDDGRTPFFLQVPVMVVTAAGSMLSLVLLPASQVLVGVGVSISAANFAGCVVSAVVLRRRIGSFEEGRISGVYLRSAAAAAVAALAGWLVAHAVSALLGHGRVAVLVALVAGGGALLGVYAGALRVLRVKELADVVQPLLRRLGR